MTEQSNKALTALYEQADCLILASEEWEKGYKDNKPLFDELVKRESRLQRAIRRYFRDLAQKRAAMYVSWPEYRSQMIKAFDVVVDITDDAFQEEEGILFKVVFEEMLNIAALGAQAGQVKYNIDLGLDAFDKAIHKATTKQVANLVKDVTEVTRNRIQSSIETSLQLGENLDEASQRLVDLLDDASRAERIARTETVRAYQNGLITFGEQSGAQKKEWQTVQLGACPICTPNDGIAVELDSVFPSGDDQPPAHPHCRCGLVLIYPDEESDNASS